MKKTTFSLCFLGLVVCFFSIMFLSCTDAPDYEYQPRPAYFGFSIEQTTDGGYVIGGYRKIQMLNLTKALLLRIDENGQSEWLNMYGEHEREFGLSVSQTSEGGFVLGGSTHGRAYIVKTDHKGTEQWSQHYGGNYSTGGDSIQQTTDGGYILCGSLTETYLGPVQIYVVKTDYQGHEQWSKTFGGAKDDRGHSIELTTDGGYIICGDTRSHTSSSKAMYLLKLDEQGQEQWSKPFNSGGYSEGFAAVQTLDGGYIAVGSLLVKTDGHGNLEWQKKTIGGSSVQQTDDNGYIICGTTRASSQVKDVILIKTDHLGNREWSQTFGGSDDDFGFSVIQTTDGGYILCGYTNDASVYIVKTDNSGNEEWNALLPE